MNLSAGSAGRLASHVGRRSSRCCAALLVTAAAVIGTAVPAYASSATGTQGYYGPVDGYPYWNQNTIYNGGSAGSYGYIVVEENGNANVPTGYLGGLAAVYAQNGALCLESSWAYNSSPVNGEYFYTSSGIQSDCGAGYYYSDGESKAYNGSGYNTYSSYASPNLYI